MTELTFLKLGGSLITDKTTAYTVRPNKLAALANELKSVLGRDSNLRLVLGHGSGSFGHFAVKEHFPRLEIKERADWIGFSEVWYRASQLNRRVMDALHQAGIPSMAIQPSASIIAKNGAVEHWELSPLEHALEVGIVPVIYGDMTFDSVKGGTVLSTEALMFHLAHRLKPSRILLAGLEDAVWADFPERRQRVGRITPKSYNALTGKVGGSHGADVTGGMKSKVEEMLRLVEEIPQIAVQIFSGEEPGNLEKVLLGEQLGTLIASD